MRSMKQQSKQKQYRHSKHKRVCIQKTYFQTFQMFYLQRKMRVHLTSIVSSDGKRTPSSVYLLKRRPASLLATFKYFRLRQSFPRNEKHLHDNFKRNPKAYWSNCVVLWTVTGKFVLHIFVSCGRDNYIIDTIFWLYIIFENFAKKIRLLACFMYKK